MEDVEKSVKFTDSPVGTLAPALGEAELFVDPELEKSTLRKFDRYVLPQMMVLVLIAYLDRSNIGTISHSHHRRQTKVTQRVHRQC